MQFNDMGLIEAGLHECDMGEFCEIFINDFVTSQSRTIIFQSLKKFLENIIAKYDLYEVWIDGSYVTNKVNPNDVDIVLFFELNDFIMIGQEWNNIRNVAYLDAYFSCAVNQNSLSQLSPPDINTITNKRNYWKGQFGFDRSDTPKGIIVIKCDKIKEFLNGGGSNVNASN